MNPELMRQLARLRILAAKENKPFDLVKFAHDLPYAKETLTGLLNTENEELLVLGLAVMNAIGASKLQDAPPAAAPVAPTAAEKTASKYVGRLR